MMAFWGGPKIVVLGTKWVAVARHGLILWENGATGPRSIIKWVPGPKIELEI